MILPQIEQNNMISNNSTIQAPQKFHLQAIETNENRSVLADLSLQQAIKKSSVKNFIKKGLLLKNDNFDASIQKMNGLQDHLLQLKNSVSQLTRQIKIRQKQSSRYRDQTYFTFQKIKKIRQERQKKQEKIAQLKRNLQRVNTKKQAACHSSKTYEHILQRMEKDKILQQLMKNQLQRQLKNLQKSQSMISAKNFSINELQKLSNSGLKDAQQQLQRQQSYRKNNLNSVNKQTLIKITKQNKLRQSQTQSDQIHQMGASDIQDADLMRLKKFLTVQVFLRDFLKSKISRLKTYYQPYQKAFFQIKSKTNVRDAASLKYQFFNFEVTYNQKSNWLRYLQGQMSQAEEQNKKLKQQLNRQIQQQIELIQRIQSKIQGNNLANSNQLKQKSLNYELLSKRIQEWLKIQTKKMNIKQKQGGNSEIIMLFKKIIDQLKISQQIQKSQLPQMQLKTSIQQKIQ